MRCSGYSATQMQKQRNAMRIYRSKNFSGCGRSDGTKWSGPILKRGYSAYSEEVTDNLSSGPPI